MNIDDVPDGNLLLRTARDQGFKPAAMLWVGTGDTSETLEVVGAASLEGVLLVVYPKNAAPAGVTLKSLARN